MTHDELLAKIDDFIVFRGALKNDFVYALRAVVELHKRIETYNMDKSWITCTSCDEHYPCPTIQAIEAELG